MEDRGEGLLGGFVGFFRFFFGSGDVLGNSRGWFVFGILASK